MGKLFTIYILGEEIKISSNLGFLLPFFFVMLHPKARNIFFLYSVTRKIQARAKVGFLATEAFSHCSNVSRQIIFSASLKMYIGVLVFLSKRYSSSRTASGCEVEINKEQSSSLC